MFWKKKKVNQESTSGIVSLATLFSYRVHDVVMEEDKNTMYFQDKGECLFIHVMASSIMLAIIQLDDEYYPLYYSEIVEHLEVHYSTLRQVCEDFNEFVTRNYDEDSSLTVVVLKWLHDRVGTGNTSEQVEIEILAGAVKAIFQVYYDWFQKNGMPIK
ncbi:hypothetical protein EBB07_28920 [Paenibacillaceae bacterium]|nr:hypothetical protein EBB07_28920 [Paenibacillaceae bacterium]